MKVSLKESIEHRAKLAYQEFYNKYKHSFCLGSWEQLTENQKEHYRKLSQKAMWEEFTNITNDTKLVFSSYEPTEYIMNNPNFICGSEIINSFNKVTNLNISRYGIKATNKGLTGSLTGSLEMVVKNNSFYWEIKNTSVYFEAFFEGKEYTNLYPIPLTLEEWENLFKKSLTNYLPCS